VGNAVAQQHSLARSRYYSLFSSLSLFLVCYAISRVINLSIRGSAHPLIALAVDHLHTEDTVRWSLSLRSVIRQRPKGSSRKRVLSSRSFIAPASLSMIRTRWFTARLISQLIPRPATEGAALLLSLSLCLSCFSYHPSPPSSAALPLPFPMLPTTTYVQVEFNIDRRGAKFARVHESRASIRRYGKMSRSPSSLPSSSSSSPSPPSSSSSPPHGERSRGVMRASRSRTTGCRGAVCVLAWASLKTVPLRSCAGRCSTRPLTRRTKVRAAARRPWPAAFRHPHPVAPRRVASRRTDPGWFLSGACTAATAVPERPIDRCPACPAATPRTPEGNLRSFDLDIRTISDPGIFLPRPPCPPLPPAPLPPPSFSFVSERTKRRARCALVAEPDLRARCDPGSRGDIE